MNNKKSMFEILEEYKPIQQELEELDGEFTDDLLERLNINRNEAVDKIEGYFFIIEKFKSEAEFLETQEKRLNQKRTSYQNKIKYLKTIVTKAVDAYGEINIKSKAAIKGKVIESSLVRACNQSYPIIKPETIPDLENLEKDIPEKYLDYNASMKVSPKDAKELTFILNKYNDKHPEAPLVIPEFKPVLNTNLVKQDLKANIKVGEMELDENFKVKFS